MELLLGVDFDSSFLAEEDSFDSLFESVFGLLSSFGVSFFSEVSFLEEDPFPLKFLAIDDTSVPSGPIIANKESTFAESPSSKPTCSKVPDWKDSNSIVALSVSISARISPSSTLSPTFFNQLATVPSSIVSESLGIVTTVTPSGSSSSSSSFESSEVSSFSSLFSSLFSSEESSSSVSLSSSDVSSEDFSSSFESDFPPPPLIRSETSSPSSPMMAKSSSTLVVSPSCTPI